jgi:methionyl aminopeptidase
MTIRDDRDLDLLKAAGTIVARVLDAMEAEVRAGITTAELDAVAGRALRRHGARSAPRLVYRFPGETCISVNDEVVHGVPASRPLVRGDLVKLDVTVEKDGYMADAARTVIVDDRGGLGARLASCARSAFRRGLTAARPGYRAAAIGRNVEREVRAHGFSVIRELCGHGIGRTIHEAPEIPNFDDRSSRVTLAEGMVFTIEPLIAAGRGEVFLAPDGWTMRTRDRSLAAHFEHTLVVTRSGPLLLTAA